MKKFFTIAIALMSAFAFSAESAMAQDSESSSKLEVKAGADLVSAYIWRGARVTGASFQPSLGFSYGGFSLGAWGSTNFDQAVNEFDLSAAYSISGLTLWLTDYCGPYVADSAAAFPKYGNYDNHILELNAGFDFGKVCKKFALTVSANVNLVNDKDENDDERYSTYIEFGYPAKAGSVDLNFALGLTPADGMYSDGFNVVNVSIKGAKSLQLTPTYSLPVFAQAILNPYTEQAYMVFGMSF